MWALASPLLPGTHHIVEPVSTCLPLASEQGAVMAGGLVPGSVEVVGHEVDEIQVSGRGVGAEVGAQQGVSGQMGSH